MILLQLLRELEYTKQTNPCNYWNSNSRGQSRKYIHALCFTTVPASHCSRHGPHDTTSGCALPCAMWELTFLSSGAFQIPWHVKVTCDRLVEGKERVYLAYASHHPTTVPFHDLEVMLTLGPGIPLVTASPMFHLDVQEGWKLLQWYSGEEKVRVFTEQKACFCPNLKTYKMESVSRGFPNCRKQERTFFLYFLLFWYANKERLQGKLYCASVRHRCYILCTHRQLSLTSDLAQTLILGSTGWSQKGVRFS